MGFPWYEEVTNSNVITQGDIITRCNIPIPNISLYESILNQTEEVEQPIDVLSANLIILSQACDIANKKIDSIVLCPIWPLDTLVKNNEYYKSSSAKESLRQGKEPSYHLLNDHYTSNLTMDFSVVDFHQIYSLPKDFLKKTAEGLHFRLRLQPPYREHLSQAFARYFMRVGLPVDIPKDKIKGYKKP